MTKPFCSTCQVEMVHRKSGVYVCVMADFGPYQVYAADLFDCPECRHEVIARFGEKHIAEHYQAGFQDWVSRCTHRVWMTLNEKNRAVA